MPKKDLNNVCLLLCHTYIATSDALKYFSLETYTTLLIQTLQALMDYHTQALCRLTPSNAESNSSVTLTPTTP